MDNARCEWCRWSRYYPDDETQVTCYQHRQRMGRSESCNLYEREPGADDGQYLEGEELCVNCSTKVPPGCGGMFKGDGESCLLNRK